MGADDDAYFRMHSNSSGVTDWYGRVGGVSNAAKSVRVTYKGSDSRGCSQAISVYNWTTGYWVRYDARSISLSETEVAFALSGTLAEYVSGSTGDGDVAIRVRCTRGDYLTHFGNADLMKVSFTK